MVEKTNILCEVPCKPIAAAIKELNSCIKSKAPLRLIYWLFGGLAFFSVVVIGGAQWKIVDRLSSIEMNVAVMTNEIKGTRILVNNHEIKDEIRTKVQDDRLRELELRESARHPEYYNKFDFDNNK